MRLGLAAENRFLTGAARIARRARCVAMLVALTAAHTNAAIAPDPDGTAPSATLRVATLNVAHGRGLVANQLQLNKGEFEANLDAVAEVIRREDPDLLAIQEADAVCAWSGGFDHVKRVAGATDFPHIHHGLHFKAGFGPLKIEYGTALLSKRPLTARNSHRFFFGQVHTKGFVTAEMQFDGRPVTVVSVHLSSGSSAARREEVDMMVARLAKVDQPLIVLGDLNSQWENENDAVRLLVSKLRLEAYRPVSNELNTFHASAARKRIDWVLISRELEFVGYRVWPDRVSDHLGVAAELRWRK